MFVAEKVLLLLVISLTDNGSYSVLYGLTLPLGMNNVIFN